MPLELAPEAIEAWARYDALPLIKRLALCDLDGRPLYYADGTRNEWARII